MKIISLLGILLIASCSKKEEKIKETSIRPVRTFTVGTSGEASNRSFSGLSKSGLESKLSFRVSGLIKNLLIKSGDIVKRNQVLATLDDSDAKIAFQQAQAQEKNAKAQQETSRSNLDRIKKLYENRSTSLNNYEQAKNNFAAATSSYKTARSTLDLKVKELSYYQLRSPFNGVIANVNIEKNETVQQGTPVIELNSGGDIEISVGIPESFIKNISKNDPVDVQFATISNKIFEARVTEVSFTLDNLSSTFPVVVKIDHPTSDIRPGMSARVTFNISSPDENKQLMVPAATVSNDKNGNFVFLLVKNDTQALVRKTYIELGKLQNNGFEVLSGLNEGAKIVNAGIEQMRDGLTVKVLNN